MALSNRWKMKADPTILDKDNLPVNLGTKCRWRIQRAYLGWRKKKEGPDPRPAFLVAECEEREKILNDARLAHLIMFKKKDSQGNWSRHAVSVKSRIWEINRYGDDAKYVDPFDALDYGSPMAISIFAYAQLPLEALRRLGDLAMIPHGVQVALWSKNDDVRDALGTLFTVAVNFNKIEIQNAASGTHGTNYELSPIKAFDVFTKVENEIEMENENENENENETDLDDEEMDIDFEVEKSDENSDSKKKRRSKAKAKGKSNRKNQQIEKEKENENGNSHENESDFNLDSDDDGEQKGDKEESEESNGWPSLNEHGDNVDFDIESEEESDDAAEIRKKKEEVARLEAKRKKKKDKSAKKPLGKAVEEKKGKGRTQATHLKQLKELKRQFTADFKIGKMLMSGWSPRKIWLDLGGTKNPSMFLQSDEIQKWQKMMRKRKRLKEEAERRDRKGRKPYESQSDSGDANIRIRPPGALYAFDPSQWSNGEVFDKMLYWRLVFVCFLLLFFIFKNDIFSNFLESVQGFDACIFCIAIFLLKM